MFKKLCETSLPPPPPPPPPVELLHPVESPEDQETYLTPEDQETYLHP